MFTSTHTDYSSIHQSFQIQATGTPDAVAMIFEDEYWTYRELNQKANQLAHYLRCHGVVDEALVGLCLERSPQMVMALLGILKAGGAYLPLDPDYPPERLRFMLHDARVRTLLTQTELLASLPSYDGNVVCLDASASEIAAQPKGEVSYDATPDRLAYVIYTSGSTGRPKGVMGLHRGVVNRVRWMKRTYPYAPTEICCQKTTLNFVDSVTELFTPLLLGVPTVIIPEEVVREPYHLIDVLAARQVSRLVLVPSLLMVILDMDIAPSASTSTSDVLAEQW